MSDSASPTTTPPPEGNYAKLSNGRNIHYLDHGEGPVVVFYMAVGQVPVATVTLRATIHTLPRWVFG